MPKIIDEIRVSEFNVMKNIISDQDIIMWESMGLTADVQSMENAALLSQVFSINVSYSLPFFNICIFHFPIDIKITI